MSVGFLLREVEGVEGENYRRVQKGLIAQDLAADRLSCVVQMIPHQGSGVGDEENRQDRPQLFK